MSVHKLNYYLEEIVFRITLLKSLVEIFYPNLIWMLLGDLIHVAHWWTHMTILTCLRYVWDVYISICLGVLCSQRLGLQFIYLYLVPCTIVRITWSPHPIASVIAWVSHQYNEMNNLYNTNVTSAFTQLSDHLILIHTIIYLWFYCITVNISVMLLRFIVVFFIEAGRILVWKW